MLENAAAPSSSAATVPDASCRPCLESLCARTPPRGGNLNKNSGPTFIVTPPQAELAPGLALLGVIDEKFIEVKDIYEPTGDGSK